MKIVLALVMELIVAVFLTSATIAHAERIKDISTLAGIRNNQLIGYGLVVGLNGTGDKSGQTFTEQSFRSMLIQLGINLPNNVKIDSKNIAAVLVTANLGPFSKKGQQIDVTVSSAGSAKSLRGGTLLMTPLKGINGRVYAIAQGPLIVSGFGASANDGSKITVNVPSVGRIPGGATVEQSILSPFQFMKSLVFNLHNPDFTTAKHMADAINKMMGPGSAHAIDAASVEVTAPKNIPQRVSYVSVLENINVKPGNAPAKIIVNSRTGTIVIGQQVRVAPVAVTHGNLTVTISEEPTVSQPNAFSRGQTATIQSSTIEIEQEKNRAFLFSSGASLKELVTAINAVGAAPGDLVAILEALKQVGALRAELIVI